jgi:hypothetical protein
MPFPPNHHTREKQIERATTRYEKLRDSGPLNIDLIRASGESKATFYRRKNAMKSSTPTETAPDSE